MMERLASSHADLIRGQTLTNKFSLVSFLFLSFPIVLKFTLLHYLFFLFLFSPSAHVDPY